MKVFHRDENRKKGDMVILISDKIDFKQKTITSIQGGRCMTKGLIRQKVYIHTYTQTHTHICRYIKQHWIT